jgi:hypothetical protein
MTTTITIPVTRPWSWDDRILPTCPACGGDPNDPFTECLECEGLMQRLNAQKKIDLSGEFSPLAQRLAESMKDDRH